MGNSKVLGADVQTYLSFIYMLQIDCLNFSGLSISFFYMHHYCSPISIYDSLSTLLLHAAHEIY